MKRTSRSKQARKKPLSLKKETVLRLVPEEDLESAKGGAARRKKWASNTCCCWYDV